MPNDARAAAAIYGVLGSGAAFSPVNPTTKRERLSHLLADLDAAAVICDPELAGMVAEAVEPVGKVPVISDFEALGGSEAPSTTPSPALEVDLAAVIYTSGSTGEPKGVTL